MQWQAATGVWSVAARLVGRTDSISTMYTSSSPKRARLSRTWSPTLFAESFVDSLRSQIVNLAGPALKPAGWDTLQKPPLEAFTDSVIYERTCAIQHRRWVGVARALPVSSWAFTEGTFPRACCI